ncbi:histamine N-methyltransferase A-like [Dendronephthya gigantea]|uniref:histamine N-methyltransferase A-like n=1 Tax=Dendronephthya gigantea TaxID=151771 RepID=UPI00106DC75D|nr:histamine N-methyltransferase A-like [Dendronephthya gigantea]
MISILDSDEGYSKRNNVFKRKCNQEEEVLKMLQTCLPIRIEKLINSSVEKQCEFKILSVGGGTGEMDLKFVEILLEELKKHSTDDQNTTIYLRVVEPNSSSCKQYSEAVKARRDLPIHVDIREQTFDEYIENEQNASREFDLILFVHSIYYFDEKQAILHCLDKQLRDEGCLLCVYADELIIKQVVFEIALERKSGDRLTNLVEKKRPNMIEIVQRCHWRFNEIFNEYPIDVSEIFVGSESGDLLLDFITQEVDFRKNADASLVDRVLAVIKNTSLVKDGKHLCMKTDTLLVVHK